MKTTEERNPNLLAFHRPAYVTIPHGGGMYTVTFYKVTRDDGCSRTGQTEGYGMLPVKYWNLPCVRCDLASIEAVCKGLRGPIECTDTFETSRSGRLTLDEYLDFKEYMGIPVDRDGYQHERTS